MNKRRVICLAALVLATYLIRPGLAGEIRLFR
jgi:hypothetical protein